MEENTTLSKKQFFAGILGNIFEHYDRALFGLLAPFMAPYFFPNEPALTALTLTYGMLALGALSKPIGALVFGLIGDRFGRKRALSMSLMGMAFVTIAIGALPTYSAIGIAAPILLGISRLFQSFFAAGETSGGAIFLLEGAQEKKKSILSSLFSSSSVVGILLASLAVLFVAFFEGYSIYLWRLPFLLGGVCGIFGLVLRQGLDEKTVSKVTSSYRDYFAGIKMHWRALVPIALAAGFSYCTYTFSITLMNGYLPLVCSITTTQACSANTILLVGDMLLLPAFGYLASRYAKEKVMLISALLCGVACIPLLSLLSGATFMIAFLVRSIIMILGVAFAASYHHWAQSQIPANVRYTIVSIATALGAQLIGHPSAAISLYLYQKTGWVAAPGLYLCGIAILAAGAVAVTYAKSKGQSLQGL